MLCLELGRLATTTAAGLRDQYLGKYRRYRGPYIYILKVSRGVCVLFIGSFPDFVSYIGNFIYVAYIGMVCPASVLQAASTDLQSTAKWPAGD